MTNVNVLILKEIKTKEQIARAKYKYGMGWVPMHTNPNTIVQTVIQLIHKRNCTGFLKLIEAGAPELTLEYTAIEFSEKFPNLFPPETIKLAKQKLEGWKIEAAIPC